jgi:hypothetical protein
MTPPPESSDQQLNVALAQIAAARIGILRLKGTFGQIALAPGGRNFWKGKSLEVLSATGKRSPPLENSTAKYQRLCSSRCLMALLARCRRLRA